MNPRVQISEVSVKVCFVGLPRHAVHAGGGIALEREERHPQQIDVEVVEERGELLLLPLPCGLPYALQRLGHAFPVLCPVRALLAPRSPRSPPLAPPAPPAVAPALFVGFAATMAGSDFSRSCIIGYGSSPSRCGPGSTQYALLVDREISRFPCKERLHMPGSPTTPGRSGARDGAPVRVAFRHANSVGTRDEVTFAAQWLAYALPCQRFAGTLAGTCARLGADADRYSFIVVDLHHLLLAGLPAH